MNQRTQPAWQGDVELFTLMRRQLYSAVIGDVLDVMGYRRQFFPAEIKSVVPGAVLAGRAAPVLEADVYHDDPAAPWGEMLAALDSLRPNEIYVASGASNAYALWGELMSTRASILGAAGAVLNGYVRDSQTIQEMKFPCFARGTYAQDQRGRGRVIAWRTPIEVGQARVEQGDIVFGDADGVLVIPQRVEKDVITTALEKVRGESKVRETLREHMSAGEAFRRFGIL